MCDNAGASGSGLNDAQTSGTSDEGLQPPEQQLDQEQDARARLMALMQYWRRTMTVPAQQQPADAPPGIALGLQDVRLPIWSPAIQQPQTSPGLRQEPASAQSLGEASPRAQACSTTPSAAGAWQSSDQAGQDDVLVPAPAAAPAARASQGSFGGSASEDDQDSQPSDGEQDIAVRQEELRARNRESARRSRARKRDHVRMLREENERLRRQLERLQSTLHAAAAQGYLTIDQALGALTGSP